MSSLHYGSEVQLDLDAAATKQAIETIASHATRGGWLTITDVHGRQWSLLISPGIPIWVTDEE